MRTTTRSAGLAALGLALLLTGCDWVTKHRLVGAWETEALPKRRLELLADGSFARRFSGKTLGFLSDALGPERALWDVAGSILILKQRDGETERSERLPIKSLSTRELVLGAEVYRRLVDTPVSPR